MHWLLAVVAEPQPHVGTCETETTEAMETTEEVGKTEAVETTEAMEATEAVETTEAMVVTVMERLWPLCLLVSVPVEAGWCR